MEKNQKRFIDILKDKKRSPLLSFEFFPPKKEENIDNTKKLIKKIAQLNPDFMTVTYGAMGGTRNLTFSLVEFIINEVKLPAASHLTCVNHSRQELENILYELERKGIKNIVALRGDPPEGSAKFYPHPQGFSCARDLVSFIKKNFSFSIAVAGYPETHPEAKSREADLRYLKEKCEAGADLVLTQLFFQAELYERFVEDAQNIGITIPIIPGIMPISNFKQLMKLTKMCGASIPKKVFNDLEKIKDNKDRVEEYGTLLAIELSEKLLRAGARGLHIYTLNKSKQVLEIVTNIKGVERKRNLLDL